MQERKILVGSFFKSSRRQQAALPNLFCQERKVSRVKKIKINLNFLSEEQVLLMD